jgi:hypothetical protein
MNLTSGPQIWRKAVFTDELQRELSDHLFHFSQLFYEATLVEVRRTAYEFDEARF